MARPTGLLGQAGGSEPLLGVGGGEDAPTFNSSGPPQQVCEIQLAEIVATSSTQMRVVGIDPGTVFNYAEDMQGGATFPPVRAYHDGAHYYLSDGFHRVEAARRIGRDTILAEIRQGTSRDATLAACAANATHGLRRTNEDKRRAVTAMLTDPEWASGPTGPSPSHAWLITSPSPRSAAS